MGMIRSLRDISISIHTKGERVTQRLLIVTCIAFLLVAGLVTPAQASGGLVTDDSGTCEEVNANSLTHLPVWLQEFGGRTGLDVKQACNQYGGSRHVDPPCRQICIPGEEEYECPVAKRVCGIPFVVATYETVRAACKKVARNMWAKLGCTIITVSIIDYKCETVNTTGKCKRTNPCKSKWTRCPKPCG